MNTRHQKPADIYAALRTVNWFVTGKRYRSSGFIALTLVDKRMDTLMLQVLERRQYRRLRQLEENIRLLSEHFRRSAQAMCKSVKAFNESIDRMNKRGSDLVITADMVRKLRDVTDAPMMVCKKALTQAHGNLADAKELIYTNRVKL